MCSMLGKRAKLLQRVVVICNFFLRKLWLQQIEIHAREWQGLFPSFSVSMPYFQGPMNYRKIE